MKTIIEENSDSDSNDLPEHQITINLNEFKLGQNNNLLNNH